MREMLHGAAWISPLLFVLVVRCVSPMYAGGSSSETVIGKVVNSDGSPACSTVVTLYPADYDPIRDAPLALTTSDMTDAQGVYCVEAPNATYNYSIVATKPTSGTRALVSGITLKGDITRAPDAVLSAPGAIIVAVPDTADVISGYLYIPGTGIAVFLNGGFKALLDKVPAGNAMTVNYASRANLGASSVLATGINVVSNDTVVILYQQWRHHRKLYLNTTASGAGVSGDVIVFPLLVRLTGSTFDFSQAQTAGADIRFIKSDNTALSYEIERWDASSKRAEIWVRVDTVYGNDSAQTITMCWGNTAAADSSNAARVFDTSNGFIGVWHMNEDPSAGDASIKDRTANAHHATPLGSMTADKSADGAIGKALRFDGTDDYLNAGNVSVPAQYSIGLWVRMDASGTNQRFMHKDSSYAFWYNNDSGSVRMEHQNSFSSWLGCAGNGGTSVPLATGTWYYLTATFDGTRIRLYQDGAAVSALNVNIVDGMVVWLSQNTAEVAAQNQNIIIPGTNSNPLLMGQGGNTSFVNGIMDEIRIEGTTRSVDWIRLCYMNQREDDKLVVFK